MKSPIVKQDSFIPIQAQKTLLKLEDLDKNSDVGSDGQYFSARKEELQEIEPNQIEES
jgi:hypothetical protein